MHTPSPHHLAYFETPPTDMTAPGAVVLRDMGADRAHRYVTHWRNEQDGGHYYGHYFADLEEAKADFAARCVRGY